MPNTLFAPCHLLFNCQVIALDYERCEVVQFGVEAREVLQSLRDIEVTKELSRQNLQTMSREGTLFFPISMVQLMLLCQLLRN